LNAQQPTKLRISGAGVNPAEFTAADLSHLPRLSVKVQNSHTKQVEEYSGVRVSDLLAKAGAPLGERLHGHALATYVVARASDGYTVVYSLAELDPALNGNEVIVADTMDGKPLDSKQGPFQVIVPSDKKATRWIRMLSELEVMNAAGTPGASKP
jgi:hypothetical protein